MRDTYLDHIWEKINLSCTCVSCHVRTYLPKHKRNYNIINGANRVQNQPVPLRDLEAFWQYILGYHNFEANFKAWLRGEAKNNQCHGTVALVRMAPLNIMNHSYI